MFEADDHPRGEQQSALSGVSRRWRAGETVVLRYLRRSDGRPGTGWAYRVAGDEDDVVALYLPRGTHFRRWQYAQTSSPDSGPVGHFVFVESDRDVLRLLLPGRWYSVWLFWQSDSQARHFAGYYINMEEPFRRSSIGFDTNDLALDIVVEPDLSWRWKDEAEFEQLVRTGAYSPACADRIREEASAAIGDLTARRGPWKRDWERWEPPASWPMPALPDGWDTAQTANWSLRSWAYGTPSENPRHEN